MDRVSADERTTGRKSFYRSRQVMRALFKS